MCIDLAYLNCIDKNIEELFIQAKKLKITANIANKDVIKIKRCLIEKVKGQLLITSCECTEIEMIEKFREKPEIAIRSEGCSVVNRELTWAFAEKEVTSGRSIHFTG